MPALDQRAQFIDLVARRHSLLDPGDALGEVGRALHGAARQNSRTKRSSPEMRS